MPRPSVAIVGAGLSGLCLAQNLLQAGVDVAVYERDASADARRQGYRITVDEHGLEALRKSLPPPLFDLVIATGGTAHDGFFRFVNSALGEIFTLHFPGEPDGAPPKRGRQMDRLTLRTALLHGLDGRVHFDMAAADVETDADGATIVFENQTSKRASIVVGADGVNSALRRRLLPRCDVDELDSCAIYGRSPLAVNGQSLVPESLARSGVLAIGRPGCALFFTTINFRESPATAFARLSPNLHAPFVDDYVMWGVVSPTKAWPADLHDATSERLLAYADAATRDYHGVLRSLVRHADVNATVAVRLRAARRPKHWDTSRATLMGDAVHVMPPFGAHGGNTALRDAALLGAKLRTAIDGHARLDEAIGEYQREMLDYAFAAVKSSRAMMRRLDSHNPLLRWMLLRAIPWLRAR